MVESKGPGCQCMVLGVHSHDGQHLAHPQAKAAITHPDEPMTEGGGAQGQAPQQASSIEADDGESRDPSDDRWRPRGVLETTPLSEEPEHTRNGTKADPHLSKASQSPPHEVDLVVHDQPLCLGFVLPETLLGLLAGLGGAVSLCADPFERLAQRAMGRCSLLGCAFPWLAALSAFGLLAHHAPSCHTPSPQAMGD